MHHRTKTILPLLAATALLALAASGASARSFSFSEKNFELIWNPALTSKTQLTFGDNSGSIVIECNVTLLGRYSVNTVAKRTEVNQGTINHGETEGCRNGTLTIRTETMPWNLRYRSFTGTLPAITTITTGMIGATFRVRERNGATCISQTTTAEPGVGIIEERLTNLETIRADETRTIRLGGEFLCNFATPGHFAGRGLIRNLPRTANITITLI